MTKFLRVSLFGVAALAVAMPGAVRAQPDQAIGAPRNVAVMRPPVPVKLTRLASLLGKDGDIRIVAFGSSSTAGAGASSPAATYPALLETDLEAHLQIGAALHRSVTVINRGRGGDDSEAMARRLQRDVLLEHPDLVIWQTGSNDPLTGVPVERFSELTRQGIAAIRATGADVVLMDQQWCKRLTGVANTQLYADALHAVAAELGVPVIRRYDMMRSWVAQGVLTPTQMIGPDGLHMTDAGYKQLAKAAAAQLLVGAGLDQASLNQN